MSKAVMEVLRFVQEADSETWSLILRAIADTQRLRDERAAASFQVGEHVAFSHPHTGQVLTGTVCKVRGRRITFRCEAAQSNYSVPASMLRRLA